VLACVWTLLIALALWWNMAHIHRTVYDRAVAVARSWERQAFETFARGAVIVQWRQCERDQANAAMRTSEASFPWPLQPSQPLAGTPRPCDTMRITTQNRAK